MTKIFFLDDDKMRYNLARRWLSPEQYDIVWAQTADEAIEILRSLQHSFDVILLDHDLGGQTHVNSDVHNTGHTVAKFLAETGLYSRVSVIIHSLNPGGASNMLATLANTHQAYKLPFGSTLLSVIVKTFGQSTPASV